MGAQRSINTVVGEYVCGPLAVLLGGFCLVLSITELTIVVRGGTLFHGPSLLVAPVVGLALGLIAGTRLGRYAAAASALSGVLVIATNLVLSMELGRGPIRYEAEVIGDTRVLISAQETFASFNGGYFAGDIQCLSEPGDCFTNLPPDMPSFLGTDICPFFLWTTKRKPRLSCKALTSW